MPIGFAQCYMCQLLFDKFEGPQRASRFISLIAQAHAVLDQGAAGLRRLAKIVRPGFRNNHLGLEGHFFVKMVSDMMEQPSDVAGLRSLVSHRKSRVQQGSVGQSAKEHDRIQQIGLAHAVRTRNAGKRTEADVDVDKVLEAGDTQASEHLSLPFRPLDRGNGGEDGAGGGN